MNDTEVRLKTFITRYTERNLAMFKVVCKVILALQSSSVKCEVRILAQQLLRSLVCL